MFNPNKALISFPFSLLLPSFHFFRFYLPHRFLFYPLKFFSLHFVLQRFSFLVKIKKKKKKAKKRKFEWVGKPRKNFPSLPAADNGGWKEKLHNLNKVNFSKTQKKFSNFIYFSSSPPSKASRLWESGKRREEKKKKRQFSLFTVAILIIASHLVRQHFGMPNFFQKPSRVSHQLTNSLYLFLFLFFFLSLKE